MKKIKDPSKTIGIVRRGGTYSASNERSEEKIKTVMRLRGLTIPHILIFDDNHFAVLCDQAKKAGYKVMVIQRGLNR